MATTVHARTRSPESFLAQHGGTAVLGGTLLASWSASIAFSLPCPLLTFTGLLCPACGATRAVNALLQADISSAGHDNVLILLVACLVLLLPISKSARIFTFDFLLGSENGARLLAAMLIVFTVARNTPFAAFLRP